VQKNIIACSLFLLAACGRTESPQPQAALVEKMSPPAVSYTLAISLSGDVEQKNETNFVATGPEIVCSAILIDKENINVSDMVEWKTDPPGGNFSKGTRAIYYLVDEKSDVKIYAEYTNDSGIHALSPKLTLSWP